MNNPRRGLLDAPTDELFCLGVKLSRNNKVYAAVLGLGVLALGVDKLFLGGGPAEAMAETPTPAPAKPAAQATAPRQTRSVAEQIDALSDSMPLPPAPSEDADAFGLPPALAGAVEAEIRRQSAERDRAAREREAEELLRSLRLTAVRIPRGDTPQALINGRLLSLGHEVPGTTFRVVEITTDEAVLEAAAGGTRVTLRLRPDAAP